MSAPSTPAEPSNPIPDRPYHHGDLPAALLAGTGTVIRRDGVGAVSIRGVAREVGVSHAAPAHHFGDKQGLLRAFARQGFERFRSALTYAKDELEEASPEDRLRACGYAYCRFVEENLAHYEVMFRPELLGEVDEEFRAAADGSFQVLMNLIADCLADPSDVAEVRRLALSTWVTTHGLASLWFDGPLGQGRLDAPPFEQLAGSVTEVLLAGLRAQPSWRRDAS